MSKLQELIRELCPDGVEYKMLGEVSEFRAGWGFPESEQGKTDGKYPFYKVSDMNSSDVFMDVANNYISEEISIKLRCKPAPKGTIIFPKIGATMGTNKKRILTKDSCYDNNVMGLIAKSSVINGMFLYYYFSRFKLMDFAKGTGAVPSLDTNKLKRLLIPIPPLEVQNEIVRIFDHFTNLAAELQAELQARKEQYEYYRNKLLAFDKTGTQSVTWLKMSELCKISTGTKPKIIIDFKTDYEYINAGTSNSGYAESYNCEGDTVTTPSRGQGGIGFIGYQRKRFWLGPLCYKIQSKSEFLSNRYLYYLLSTKTDAILRLKKEGGTPALNASDLGSILIPIPPLSVQQRIVSILDKFEALVNDLTEGLPAEIAAVQEQYEYYRNKLLSFPKSIA